ncbi:ob-fold nucleic acid binding domain-containing protein [Nannochloropsis oceanica]
MAAPLPPMASSLPVAALPPPAIHTSHSPPLRPARYTKVDLLTPASLGHNLVLRVLRIKTMLERARVDGSITKIAEVTVGDETGTITLRARNGQVDFLVQGLRETEEDETKPLVVVVRNAGVAMYKGHMRLIVNKWGKLSRYPDGISSTPSAPFEVNEETDKSGVEYELIHRGPEGVGEEEEEDNEEEEIGNEEEMAEEI